MKWHRSVSNVQALRPNGRIDFPPPSHNPLTIKAHSLPDGTQDPCGYRRNAYPRIICLSPGHAATNIMRSTLASVSVSTESVTVFTVRNGTSKAANHGHVE